MVGKLSVVSHYKSYKFANQKITADKNHWPLAVQCSGTHDPTATKRTVCFRSKFIQSAAYQWIHEGAKTDNCHNSWQEHGIQLYCNVLLQ